MSAWTFLLILTLKRSENVLWVIAFAHFFGLPGTLNIWQQFTACYKSVITLKWKKNTKRDLDFRVLVKKNTAIKHESQILRVYIYLQ